MTLDEMRRAAEKALKDLGDTKELVALSLQAKGIKGKVRSCQTCPIAQFLESLGFEGIRWEVGLDDAYAQGTITGPLFYVSLPKACTAFIITFDRRDDFGYLEQRS